MIVTYASLAQAAGTGALGGGIPGFVVEIVVILAIFYFLMIRPQQQQRKKHEDALRALRKGDQIVTAGGIVGKIIFIKETTKDGEPVRAMDDLVTIETGEARIVVERGRIARVAGGSTTGTSV